MNKHLYRLVFNKLRGLMMVVGEHAAARGKADSPVSPSFVSSRSSAQPCIALVKPLAFAIQLAIGAVTLVAPFVQAQVVVDATAPKAQQPTILTTASGVTQVNIQTPSAAGVSRNTYNQFDVNQQGVILNNARTNIQSQLGGWVSGNPSLANGTARVILNEVNSSNASQLQGYVEVAGSRAQVVIANPAGVTCNGCGFINANRVTLTTGTPIMNGGDLEGYLVQRGTVRVEGAGLDASQADFTDIIGRAVQVNAGIWTNSLQITAGANQVSADQSRVTAISGADASPQVAIDVSQLGGMYAGKITLVGTEAGVGVRNAGRVGASAGEVIVTADGRVENSGAVSASSDVRVNAGYDITNTGSLFAQRDVSLATQGSISNEGIIAASRHASLSATGTTSRIISGSASVLGAGINGDGSLGASGNLELNATKDIHASGQNVAAGNQLITAASIDLTHSQTSAENLNLTATAGNVNAAGATLAVTQTLTANTAQSIITDDATVSAQQLNFSAVSLSNARGDIVQTGVGNTAISLSGTLDNTQGRIAVNSQNLTLHADRFVNSSGTILHAGTGALQLDAASLANQAGTIHSTGSAPLSLHVAGTLDNSAQGSVTASGDLAVTANAVNNAQGSLTAGQDLQINVMQTFGNAQGLAAAGQNVNINASSLDNTAGTIGSVQGAVTIASTGSINNTQGRIETTQRLTVSGVGMNNADGILNGKAVAIDSASATFDNTRGTVSATDTLTFHSGILTNDAGLIQASGAMTIDTHGQTLSNQNSGNSGGIIGQSDVAVSAGNINNQAGFIGARGDLTLAGSQVTNTSGGAFTGQQAMTVTASGVDNRGGQMQALGNLILGTGSGVVDNSALNANGSLIRSGATLTINAGSVMNVNAQAADQGLQGNAIAMTAAQVNNTAGAILADDTLTVTGSGNVNNTQGLISSAKNVAIQDVNVGVNAARSQTVTNTSGTIIGGQDVKIDSASLSGDGKVLSQGNLTVKLVGDYTHTGELAANGNGTLETAGTVTNNAVIAAGNSLSVKAATIDNQAGGSLSAQSLQLQATSPHTLINRGLIDGQDTFIDTITLNNLGTGRIYGDHVAINATTVTNDAENGTAPVIAARNRLDVGAQTITNREHALIFSAGDMAIGGSLDASKQAIGQTGALNNHSATIESLGNMSLAAAQINNTNEHFSSTVQQVSSEAITEYQGSGSPNRYLAGTPGVYTYLDQSLHLQTPEGSYESWVGYYYNRTVSETTLQMSDPGVLRAGGNMSITGGNVLNDKSQISAGGALNVNVATLNNIEDAGQRVTTDSGTVTSYWRHFRKGTDDTGSSSAEYAPPAVIQDIRLGASVYQGNLATAGTGTLIASRTGASVSQTAAGASAAVASIGSASLIAPIVQVPARGNGGAIRTTSANTTVPNNSLFQSNPNPAGTYVIQTDPRFASYRTWLSSDYMLQQLAIDPATAQKRLGDGFYEQKLVREQIAQLTGRRFLDGYASDEAEYRSLIDNAVTYAKQWNLRPGVALTAEQMAQLTSDIVWLVEREVTLPNGQTTRALVPQVYVRVKEGDLDGSGTLLAGQSVNLNIAGNLVNSGTIAGRTVTSITAENIQNLGGRMTGNDVVLQAKTDLNNLGGRIDAVNSLTAIAGRDLNVTTTTRTQANSQGSVTNLGRVAGLYVTGSNGTLIAASGHDINLDAAIVSNGDGTGKGSGSTLLAAGNNLNLGTVTQSSSHQIIWDGKNRRQDSTVAEAGSTIQTQGDLQMQAGSNINARAANITSNAGAVQLQAGQDVNITAGQTNQSVDEAHQHKGKSGMLSSKTITTRDTLDQTTAQGSTLSGNTVAIEAGRNIALTGSNAVSTGGTSLTAQNDIAITAATNSTEQSHFHQEKTSGMFSGGGFGVTIGTKQLSTDQRDMQTTASASTVGSVNGNVSITAGNRYTQAGSDVLTPQGNIDIRAKAVDIVEARNTDTNTVETKFKQSGLTVALSSPVLSAIQTAQAMGKAASQTSDGRMKALAGATTALAAKDAYNAVQAGQGTTINGKEGQIRTGTDTNGDPTSRDANAADKAGGINLSISIGASKSQSTTVQTSNAAAVSRVAAGGDIHISATGAGPESNLTVQGSDIKAGNNIALQADNQINLLAASNTNEQHSTNSSASGSIGISIGTSGFGVTASASAGRGHADGSDQSWSNTHVEAGNQFAMASGGDTTIKGAVASGNQVTAKVGGNLNIASLQDTSVYDSKQQSIGGSITVGAGVSGSVSFSNSKVNSNYASVTEQSGIRAGDGGFNVNVAGNTDLKGGAITSTQAAVESGSNRFATGGTLTTSDIQNHASYSAKSIGVTVGSSVNQSGKYQPSGTSAGVGSDSGSANSVTQAAISGVAGNKEARTGDREKGIGRIFDAQKVQNEINAQVTITQAFGQQASNALTNYVSGQRKDLQKHLKEATTDEERNRIQGQINQLNTEERVMNVLIGVVTGQTSVAVAQGVLSEAADQMRQQTIKNSQLFAGVTDGTTTLSNMSGPSNGVQGDGVKAGGTRVDLDIICGPDNKRCITQKNSDGTPALDSNGKTQLVLDSQGKVQFDSVTAGMTLAKFLEENPEGKKAAGPTGGIQGMQGTLFDKPYTAGSWQDKLIEAFSGPHDFIGGQITGLYDSQGNIKREMSNMERGVYDNMVTTTAIPIAAPFAAAHALPPQVWNAISLMLNIAK